MNENRLFFSYCHAEKKRMDEIVPLVEGGRCSCVVGRV